jgi:hypothetical protein
MTTDLDLKPDYHIDDSEIGRRCLFWIRESPEGTPFGFASKFENIGHVDRHDCWLKNKTEVIVMSEPIEAVHPTLGKILVSKVVADKVMWVGTHALRFIEDKND